MTVLIAGVHLPREEGRGHCCAEWPQQDGQLRLLEPGLPSGASSTNIFSFHLLLFVANFLKNLPKKAQAVILAKAVTEQTAITIKELFK